MSDYMSPVTIRWEKEAENLSDAYLKKRNEEDDAQAPWLCRIMGHHS